jgi:arylsulfatase A-like enzyme
MACCVRCVFLAAAGWLALFAPARADDRPNILFLLSDDHNYRALGCAGDPLVKTPTLDRLASEGVRFTHAFTCFPQCSPSRAALLTGRDSWRNGVRRGVESFAADSQFWPRLLADAGYDTFITGKWHNAGMPWDYGFQSGANLYVGGSNDHSKMPLIQWNQSKKDAVPPGTFSSTAFADATLSFLGSRSSSEKPFCAYVSFTAPHDPWIPPGEYASMYSPDNVPLPKNFMPRPPFRIPEGFEKLRDQATLPFPRTEADVKRAQALYAGMLSHLDSEIGRILSGLEAQGLTGNTVVIFMGDHGHSLGSHGFVGKQCMYEEGIRQPLILRHPRLARGSPACAELVMHMDLFPTLCDIAGVAVPGGLDGKSLLPLYEGKGGAIRSEVLACHHSPEGHLMSSWCLRTKTHKSIHHLLTGEFEFFDLEADPWELENLAGCEEVARIELPLRERLLAWQAASLRRGGEPVPLKSSSSSGALR